MDEIKRIRTTAKRRFNRKVELFQEAHKNGESPDTLQVLYNDICDSFDKADEANEQLIGSLNDGDSCEEYESYIKELEVVKCKSLGLLNARVKNKPKVILGIKKLEPPKFSGSVRAFPSFIRDYERLVVAQHGKDPYVLKISLEGEPRKLVEDLDDYEKMWDRLKEAYGNRSKMIDSVLYDIKSAKPIIEGDNKRLIILINMIEKAWLDVNNLGLTQELENTTVLTQVERLLPTVLKREWAAKVQNLETDRFKNLVKYLTEQRKALEYLQDDSRNLHTKVAVHTMEHEKTRESELLEAIRLLTVGQEKLQSQMSECLNNLAVVNERKFQFQKSKINPRFEQGRKYCLVHDSDTHDLQECVNFKQWTKENQMDFLKQKGICFSCLKEGHLSRNCDRKFPCRVKVNGESCGKNHHSVLHPLFSNVKPQMLLEASNNNLTRKGVLLMTGFVTSENHAIPTLYDAGSNLSLITFRMAKKLGLKGTPIHLSVTKVGDHTEELDSFVYTVRLRDKWGKERIMEACGMSELTIAHGQTDTDQIAKIFRLEEKDIKRPEGRIELLIGSDYCALLPQVVKTIGNIQLLSNDFGYCVRGSIKGIEGTTHVQINHISCRDTKEWLSTPRHSIGKTIEMYFNEESLGTECIPKCGGCKCGECTVKGNLTIQEERELKLIDEGLSYESENQSWISRYPWISDPNKLPNSFSMALARLKATERRLERMGMSHCTKYQEQIQDMLDRGVAEKLSREQMDKYKGPVFYLPHHEIYKSSSASTPVRLVFNSAASYQGVSLNSLLAKGPDGINDMLGILMRFREEQVGIVGDVKKMFNSVKISELDMHTHRFLWRNFDKSRNPDHYILKTVTFGDKPSGAIAMLALRKTAELTKKYPMASRMIIKDSYVDDIIGSLDSKKTAVERIDQVEEILKLGGFIMKNWIISGEGEEDDDRILNTTQGKVLGLGWKPKRDHFTFSIKLNFSKRTREGRAEPDITMDELETRMPDHLTKRNVLSQIATLYDPLGLLTPFTLKSKLLMREIILEVNQGNVNDWDAPVSEKLYRQTKDLFKEMFLLENISFNRCIKPAGCVTNPELVIFCDSSLKAYGAVAYIRWEVEPGSYCVNLLCSKNRIAPMRQITIPRLELCAAVLASRLRSTIEREMNFKFARVIHITDSEIVRAQIQKESYKFNTFVGNRIAEIQSKTQPSDWYWVASKVNSADLTTRECSPKELDNESLWQRGPDFLYDDFSKWPVKQGCMSELPDVVFARVALNASETSHSEQLMNIENFSDYKRLLSVTARVIDVFKKKSFKAVFHEPTNESLQLAEKYWIKQAQLTLPKDWEKRFKRLGPKLKEDGIIVVGSRISKWLRDDWNCNEFIILPAKHSFSKLYMLHAHKIDHSGVESSIARVQLKFWIPRARKTMRTIKQNCVTCRKIDKKCTSQLMGELPKERLDPCPPWYNVSLDLFGPFWICDTVKRRVKRRVYGIIITCLVTRAVHLDIAEGYDTKSFLTVFKRFTFLRGFPNKVFSDNGTQLVSANKELREMVAKWNKSDIFNFGKFEGLKWVFNKSADAPWENSCSEALIRLVKRLLTRIIGDSVVSFGDLQTVMYEVGNLMNERPIGFKHITDIDEGTILRPNDILLGRSTIEAPCGFWNVNSDVRKSYDFKQKVVDVFWKKWMKNYFPSLIVRQKWHTDVRNVQPGDVVLVKDQNPLKGEWKIAQVVESLKSKDGRTRDVKLRYKVNEPGIKYNGQRDLFMNRSVHRLVVLLPIEEQI